MRQPEYKVVQRGMAAVFECKVTHDPSLLPTMTWLKDNDELPDDERSATSLCFLKQMLFCYSILKDTLFLRVVLKSDGPNTEIKPLFQRLVSDWLNLVPILTLFQTLSLFFWKQGTYFIHVDVKFRCHSNQTFTIDYRHT